MTTTSYKYIYIYIYIYILHDTYVSDFSDYLYVVFVTNISMNFLQLANLFYAYPLCLKTYFNYRNQITNCNVFIPRIM